MTARTVYPKHHVVHMSLDHGDPRQSFSVARCDCGWRNTVAWPGHHDEQDAAVEAHWVDVEQV